MSKEQYFFTKEITKRSVHPDGTFKYCPRCDNVHEGMCELVQMIVEFDPKNINSNTNCSITFLENIKIEHMYEISKEDSCKINMHRCDEMRKRIRLHEKYVIPVETSFYSFNDNVITSNFNLKLFADSFADDELESFRCSVTKFLQIFNIDIDRYVNNIKYLLLTEYKNKYVDKQQFLEKHIPKFYEDVINNIIEDTNYKTQNPYTSYLGSNNKTIIYKKTKLSSNALDRVVIEKIIKLYLDFIINPLFHANMYEDKKPNPHISKKTKLK